MANASYLLILLASLGAWQSAADDVCGSVECLPSAEPVCGLNEETDNMALFADECVLHCINCRMATQFKKVNGSLCSTGTMYIPACPGFALNNGNEETATEVPDNEIEVVQIDFGQGGSDGLSGLPPFLGDSPALPLPLLPIGSELLRRLVMSSQPEPPPSPAEGLTLISADVKVDVTINVHPPPPPPPPPAVRLALPPPLMLPPPLTLALPRMPLLAPPPPPPPQPLELSYEPQRTDIYTAVSASARPSVAAAIASLIAMTVAVIHI